MYQDFLEQMEDFIFVEEEPKKADIIFVPGNGYPQNAERAAELYRQGLAPLILPSGRYSISVGTFSGVLARADRYSGNYETEWAFMKDVLQKNGVPETAILKEDQATYTYENALFSREVTDQWKLEIKTALLCCKNYHARRALMYYQMVFPEADIRVCPSCVDGIDRNTWKDSETGIQEVTKEVTRIIHQFSFLMKK